MDKERMAELEKIEAHGAENGWVAPIAEEDREFFAYFRSVFKRYNITDEGVICNSKVEIQNGVMLLLDFIFPVIHHLTSRSDILSCLFV